MTNEAGFDCAKKNVLICDTQPVAVEGMKWLIENSGDLRFAGAVLTLDAVFALLNPEAARLEAELAAAQAAAEIAASEAEAAAEAMELAALAAAGAAEIELAASGAAETGTYGEVPESPAFAAEASVAEALTMAAGADGAFVNQPEVLADFAELSGPQLESQLETEAETLVEALVEAAAEPEASSIVEPIDAVVIDKGLGMAGVMNLLQKLTSTSHPTVAVVWGAAINEAEALRLLQAGARGILRRTSESGTLLTCLRAVTAGGTWMEDGIFGSTEKLFNPKRSQLTQREREVVVLVEKGLRNRDIARMLGIQTGTVKIHLKHIFEKTGVRGRYGLAFTGLQNKGSIAMTAPAHFTA